MSRVAHTPEPAYSQLRMVVDLDTLDALIARGATRVDFHADGSLASVLFGPPPALADQTSDPQHENPSPVKRKRATGGLVPRADGDSS